MTCLSCEDFDPEGKVLCCMSCLDDAAEGYPIIEGEPPPKGWRYSKRLFSSICCQHSIHSEKTRSAWAKAALHYRRRTRAKV